MSGCGCEVEAHIWRENVLITGAGTGANRPVAVPFEPVAVSVGPGSEYAKFVLNPAGRLTKGYGVEVGVGAPYIGPKLARQLTVHCQPKANSPSVGTRFEVMAELIFWSKVPPQLLAARAPAHYAIGTGIFGVQGTTIPALTTSYQGLSAYDVYGLRPLGVRVPAFGRSRGSIAWSANVNDTDDLQFQVIGGVSRQSPGYDGTALTEPPESPLENVETVVIDSGAIASVSNGHYNFSEQICDYYYVQAKAVTNTITDWGLHVAIDLYD